MAILPADNKISLACDFADLGDRLEIKLVKQYTTAEMESLVK